ncbi:MAG: NAD(P)-dependent glycerol-3-phosphate dehydrogenase [Alphaproteobacteria bacterium]|nr:NAD(P)-dependent glycerol-3-phosphate dehydrogenase [Alphaproteobacteria bacterium]
MQTFGIIGGGAWGTALAQVLRRAGHDVALWAREAEVVAAINDSGENAPFLPGVKLAAGIRATGDLSVAARADAVLLATPAQHLREIATRLAPHLAVGAPLVLCTKGIEENSGALMSEVAAAVAPRAPLAVLSGPTFAQEVAHGLPTAVTLAATDAALGAKLVAALGGRSFRPYLSADPVGAQVGGAVKNVLAIACGIVMGKRFGDNARAALITRGLAEMVRLAVAKGGRAETLMGLSGLGDLTLTCTGLQSRNLSLGVALGQGQALQSILVARRSVAEGVTSSGACVALAKQLGIEMPIAQAVDAILHKGAAVDREIEALLARPFKAELTPGTT